MLEGVDEISGKRRLVRTRGVLEEGGEVLADDGVEHGLALARVSPRTEFLATRGYGHHRVLRRNDVIRRIVQFISA